MTKLVLSAQGIFQGQSPFVFDFNTRKWFQVVISTDFGALLPQLSHLSCCPDTIPGLLVSVVRGPASGLCNEKGRSLKSFLLIHPAICISAAYSPSPTSTLLPTPTPQTQERAPHSHQSSPGVSQVLLFRFCC